MDLLFIYIGMYFATEMKRYIVIEELFQACSRRPPPSLFHLKKIYQKSIAYQEQLTRCVSCQRAEASKHQYRRHLLLILK